VHDRIKETLRKAFAELANDLERRLRKLSQELASLAGTLEVHFLLFPLDPSLITFSPQGQQTAVQSIQSRLPPLTSLLASVSAAESACDAANVEENDYTVFSHADLQFELGLLSANVAKKITFIENQIVSRNMTNLTPAQLEQFESTFRYFDRDETNTLRIEELAGALAALGIVYSVSTAEVTGSMGS